MGGRDDEDGCKNENISLVMMCVYEDNLWLILYSKTHSMRVNSPSMGDGVQIEKNLVCISAGYECCLWGWGPNIFPSYQ